MNLKNFPMKTLFLASAMAIVTMISCQQASDAKAERQDDKRWQQRAEYVMEVDMNTENHRYTGSQSLKYYNNSPDTLHKVFYHLYFNAFQPNSAMDMRSRTIQDPDRRVGDRISKLADDEIGFLRISNLKMNGKDQPNKEVGTILEVSLTDPIMPNSSVTFDLNFEGQVPVQIRRSGRDSDEGIDYSMSQWYPKMSEYDYQGWHANPYIGREFHGIWGDFDVKITIDSSYVLGGTGYLQNPQEIGHGYEDEGMVVNRPNSQKLTWHFKAPNVHDFMWGADPDYTHTKRKMADGKTTLHFFYVKNSQNADAWAELPELTEKAFDYINANFGQYPYDQFSVVMGGDGGMEYPMSTLVTGNRGLRSLIGVTVHEALHSWYQGVLGSNESLYAWMDEGFTSYASGRTMAHLFNPENQFPNRGSYGGYINLAKSGLEEPMSTHADHFHTNFAYGAAAYSKGAVFMAQIGYVIGEKDLSKGLLRYFDEWKFRHPNPNDVIRVMEKVSGLELDWYKEYMLYTTKTIDYGIGDVKEAGGKTTVELQRIGLFPMPIDLYVTYQDGSTEVYNIPLQIMRGAKPQDADGVTWITAESWSWTHPTYILELSKGKNQITKIEIDPTERLADINRDNNIWEK
jgi:hypothetical protein